MIRRYKSVFLIILLLTLTSCGFHLRGKIDFPPQLNLLYIDSAQPYGPFERILRQTLTESDITLVPSAEQANAILKITAENFSQTTNAISPSNSVQQYNLYFTVTYDIRNSAGKVIVAPQTVTTSKSFTADSNQMLGSNIQQNNIEDSMRRDTVFLLTSQLTSIQTRNALNTGFAHNATQPVTSTSATPATAKSAANNLAPAKPVL